MSGLPGLGAVRRLESVQNADAVVIGAGLTGLATARRLAQQRPDWRVVLVEGQRVGSGASGRNSGFVVDLPHFPPTQPIELNQRWLRLSRGGLSLLRERVRNDNIECAWTENGRLHGAVGDLGQRALDSFAAALTTLGEPYEYLSRDGVACITGSAHYRAALRTAGGAIVQPCALVRGIARSLPPNVDLFEESVVQTIRLRRPFEVVAGNGTLRTSHVFLATNGYTPGLGYLKGHLFPLLTFGSLTRVLTADEQNALGGEAVWGMVSEVPMGATVRRTSDQRILIRNSVIYTRRLQIAAKPWVRIRENHRRSLVARFPQLAKVPFEFSWSGVMGVSFNGTPYFGQLSDGLYAAAGFNGVGVALGTMYGTLLADLALGADSALLDDAHNVPAPSRLPPEPVLGVGVRATLSRLLAKAAEEQ